MTGEHDLPEPLLGLCLSFVDAPKDRLAALAVSRRWLAAAEAEVPQWWSACTVDEDKLRQDGALAKRLLLRGVQRHARRLRELHLSRAGSLAGPLLAAALADCAQLEALSYRIVYRGGRDKKGWRSTLQASPTQLFGRHAMHI